MKLAQYIDYKYQELALSLRIHKDEVYSVAKDAEMKALQEVLSSYRSSVKFLMKFKVMWDFMLVNLGKKKEPEPALTNELKKQQKAKEEAEAKKKADEELIPNLSSGA